MKMHPLEKVKIGQFLKIGKNKMKVNRHSRNNWRNEKENQRMVKSGSQDPTVWGTVEVDGIPHCASAQLFEGKVDLEIYKELDPGYCFIGGEGSYLDEKGNPDKDCILEMRKSPNAFGFHKKFKY
jgi:hypothetical protein